MQMWVSKLSAIGSDNGSLHGWYQALFWTNARILLIQNLGMNLLSEIHTFSFKKMHMKYHLQNGVNFISASMCLNRT